MTAKRQKRNATGTSTAMAKPEQFTAKDVPGMLALLDKKLEGFKNINESNYRTAGTIDGVGDIKTLTNLSDLVKAAGVIVNSEEIYTKGSEALGLKEYPQFSYKGSPSADWLLDIKLRYDIINQKETIDQLNEFKRELESFMTEEDKKAALVGRMQNFFRQK